MTTLRFGGGAAYKGPRESRRRPPVARMSLVFMRRPLAIAESWRSAVLNLGSAEVGLFSLAGILEITIVWAYHCKMWL